MSLRYLIVIITVFGLDRLSKWYLHDVFDLPSKSSIEILRFFSLTTVWNRGISMGMFQADDDTGRWLLIGLTGLITILLIGWLTRAKDSLLQMALALVIGGSLGNIWDRVSYGAVFDFLHFHAFNWSFYVFNVADASITFGVILLLWDALLSPQNENKQGANKGEPVISSSTQGDKDA